MNIIELHFKQILLSPKTVNYEYNQATILNNYYCRPNPSIMNIIKPQFQTVNNVAQISQL